MKVIRADDAGLLIRFDDESTLAFNFYADNVLEVATEDAYEQGQWIACADREETTQVLLTIQAWIDKLGECDQETKPSATIRS